MTFRFEKWSGAGNDLLLIAAAELPPGVDGAALAAALCPRGFGLGADGLLLVAGVHAEYWNADGSPAAFCGNGARCVGRYLLERDRQERVAFTLGEVPAWAWAEPDGTAVEVPAPRLVDRHPRTGDPAGVLGRPVLDEARVEAGVPLLVLLLDGEPGGPLAALAEPLQRRAPFAPGGTNLTCLWQPAEEPARLRTWERGVRAETLACGSAALAAAWLLYERGAGGRVALRSPGGSVLEVERRNDGWVLRGPAVRLCRGVAQLPAGRSGGDHLPG